MQKKYLEKLEFDKVLEQLAQFAKSEIGVQKVRELMPLTRPNQVVMAMEQTQDAVTVLRLKGGLPNPILKDVTVHLKRLDMQGILSALEIAQIGKVLSSTKEMVQFFTMLKEEKIVLAHLPKLVSNLVVLNPLLQTIIRSIHETGSVLDEASPALKGIRTSIKRQEQAIRETLDQLLRTKASQLSDAIITMRGDSYVLPVKQEFRYTFGGVIRDQSSSGQTVYIEPKEIQSLTTKLRHLHEEEQDEINRILWELCEKIAPHSVDILLNNRILGELDFINAKALYARDIRATKVDVDSTNVVALYAARHPLIDRRVVVKNDILIGGDFQSIVITGPNTGGKTILLKTLGLLQIMGQSGLHLPVEEGSQIGVFTQIFADIGDEQSIEQNLSTFSSHMTNIVSILDQIDEKSLVLFDELGSGTDPQEGSSLAIAILDYIGQKQSYVVATTHYPELKMYGYNRLGTVNASMEFDSVTLAPTYKFLLGIPGKSNAFDISKRLGLDETIIQQARSLVHEDSQQLNDMITALEELRQHLTKEKEQVERDVQQANAMLKEAQKEKDTLEAQKEKIMQQALDEANALVEKTKEEANEIMSQVRQMQLRQGNAVVKEHEFIEKRTQLERLKHEESLKKNKVLQRAKRQKNLSVGDNVEVMSYGQRGVIEQKLSQEEFIVKMGMLRMKVTDADLRLLDGDTNEKQKYIPRLRGARTKVTSQLDLRGQRYENALVELDRYLDAAILAGYAQVTIVHGRGTGAVRDGVTKALRKHRSVDSFEFAPINQGGNGATIVRFKG
ncbi:endonuclease MutS2 [Carnobacteriaceae bacterium zg-C25]|nr:endonuclease MutS2 [Carnobacteriaceae bacterium zg-ZUI240]QTU82811.1 endonuclease MutS2 [Carnobacteriaceae bacterium zg-C25]